MKETIDDAQKKINQANDEITDNKIIDENKNKKNLPDKKLN